MMLMSLFIDNTHLNSSVDFIHSRSVGSSKRLLPKSNIENTANDAELNEFFSRLREQKQKLRLKRRQRWQKQKEKIQKELDDEEKAKNERMKAKHEELVKRREMIEHNIEERKKLRDTRNQSVDEYHHRMMLSESKPLFIKYEENYKNNILLPELDRGKEILKKRKEYMKQITNLELVKHERNYLTDLEIKVENLKEARNKDIIRNSTNISKYKSKLIERIKERDLEEALKEQEK